jgi:rhodanese-related sulfurtransferase
MKLKFAALLLIVSVLAACATPTPTTEAPAGVVAAPLFSESTTVTTESGKFYQISPAILADGLKSKNFFFVNTHTPYEGEIEQTDAFLKFDEISLHFSELPADKNAPIVLYCRSGRMSAIAATTLANAGYTNVWDLAGGLLAWEAAGLTVLHK